MSWTDERVDLLRKLWTEGLSASQIAAELGGVTRNAVIGKIHRLGLSGRNKGTAAGAPRRKTATARSPSSGARAKSSANAKAGSVNPRPATELPDIEKPKMLMLDLLQLTEQTCKYPVGDPQEEGFGFCGVKVRDGDPYCEYHCRLAYQPAAERRQRSGNKTNAPRQLPSASGFNTF